MKAQERKEEKGKKVEKKPKLKYGGRIRGLVIPEDERIKSREERKLTHFEIEQGLRDDDYQRPILP